MALGVNAQSHTPTSHKKAISRNHEQHPDLLISKINHCGIPALDVQCNTHNQCSNIIREYRPDMGHVHLKVY